MEQTDCRGGNPKPKVRQMDYTTQADLASLWKSPVWLVAGTSPNPIPKPGTQTDRQREHYPPECADVAVLDQVTKTAKH
ncbi:MAG: hypothetical protein HOC36_02515 [Candidatus Magasanikbacteria bacterium]|nr:hypothetical protein [Candidatus Magasanikbacteria bacterium]MBT4547208.1 hypothetical protein [Candidatus Magasanikbacteria bacterium]